MNASKFCFMVLFYIFLALLSTTTDTFVSEKAYSCPRAEGNAGKQAFSADEQTLPQGKLYIFAVPKDASPLLSVGVSPQLATVESPIWKSLPGLAQAFFVINGGFFDPGNAKTTSFLYQSGVKVGDPHDNRQLVDNPKIQPYLPMIFNRPELRIYECNKTAIKGPLQYDIVPHNAPIPEHCTLRDALGAGPQLLPQVTAREEGFIDYDAAGKVSRDPIGVNAKNARSAVGITAKGDLLIMMGAQVPEEGKKGFSLQDMADQMKRHGAVKAMALDGGSSSGFFYKGTAHYGKFNKDGTPVIRPVKSVLMLMPR